MPSANPEAALRAAFEAADQSHVFAHWEMCSEDERASLLAQLSQIDLQRVTSLFSRSMADHASGSSSKGAIEPVRADDVASNPELSGKWNERGLRAAADGELAVVLLAGGQGTRLGSASPKGMYDIGLPSGRTLFRVQCERLVRLQRNARERFGKDRVIVPLYVMTSPFTHDETVAYFESRAYFGLDPGSVTFFQQGWLPCFSETGAVVMKSRYEVATAPDGNGGVYAALQKNGCIDDMLQRKIKHVYAYCVDNAAVKVGDPTFVGFCDLNGFDAGAKVIKKAYASEPVGVFTRRNDAVHVVEYSEMPEALASALDDDGVSLKFDAANVALHYYSFAFLRRCCAPDGAVQRELAYHVARKKIPRVSECGAETLVPDSENGVKLEAFIFDAYAFAETVGFLQGDRFEDFAPVKNKEGSGKDSPDTARRLLSDLHRKWIARAGGEVVGDGLIEVSPLVSYGGEGLERVARGKKFAADSAIEEDVWNLDGADAEARGKRTETATESSDRRSRFPSASASKRTKTK
jgi:UDP-N-acetylglucosamine/UDP-N-acetylgalactosamine diphosphorylase